MVKQTILAGALALAASTALAQEVKVGVVLPYTGIGAEFGQPIDRGIELYLKLNADKVQPYKITLIKRDVKDPSGANARDRGAGTAHPGQRRRRSPAGSIRRTRSRPPRS